MTVGILLFKPLFHISKGGLIGDAHFPLAFHFLQVFLGGRQQSDKGFHLLVSQGLCLGGANLDFCFYIWKDFAQFLCQLKFFRTVLKRLALEHLGHIQGFGIHIKEIAVSIHLHFFFLLIFKRHWGCG